MAARKKSGFTLIELLVVIAIIAILAAILFPVFARAREAARKSTCQSNMKECGIALQTYWNDYDATLPCSIPAGSTMGTTGDGTDGGFPEFGAAIGVLPPPSNAVPRTWAQMLWNSMKSKDIVFCPSDSAEHSPAAAVAHDYNQAPVSYRWKFAIDRAWRHGAIKAQKESQFGYNSDQIVMYERAGFHSGAATGLKNNETQINVVFLDTHVKSVTVVNNPNTTGVAAYGPMATGEPNYFNFDNQAQKVKDVNPPNPANLPQIGTSPPYAYINPEFYSDML